MYITREKIMKVGLCKYGRVEATTRFYPPTTSYS